ncbi:MAG: hypothetical protein HYZ74_06170, partial [Elusimicrobia bacterium]|nr:hypothetical protein [Elusimicrobiota bacterium]
PEDAIIWLNLVKTSLRLKRADKAQEFGDKAIAVNAGFTPYVKSLLKGS